MVKRILKNIRPASFFTSLVLIIPLLSSGQSYTYWTRSFNEESSLLSGAVVGGGSGPTSIYYNPASISEVKASKLSLNASLFSFDFINLKNALGNDINVNSTRGKMEPRFVSYMIKSRRFKNWSFEVAFLNNENASTSITESVDNQIDILTGIPGDERYFAIYQYSNRFRDDWLGAGGSVRLSDRLVVGVSMFVTVKSLEYKNSIDIEAYPMNDSAFRNNAGDPFYVASYESTMYLKFNDYRLTWKGGILYHADNFSVGLSVTTPSLGGIYSDGKRDYRKEKQSNITMPGTGEPLPDYIVVDFQEKKNLQIGYRTPFSVAAGFTGNFSGGKRTVYLSVEYFSKTEPYRMVEAEESPYTGSGYPSGDVLFTEWLTYVRGARPVFNGAVGYSLTLKKGLLLMGGFRTDFNYVKNLDYGDYSGYNKMMAINSNLYHITCGLSWNIFGQDIITGFEYTLGDAKNQKQFVNLSDPVEYNTVENKALQGTCTNDMHSLYNSISIYLGASFNFGEKKK